MRKTIDKLFPLLVLSVLGGVVFLILPRIPLYHKKEVGYVNSISGC